MKCPQCVAEGKVSRVYEGGTFKTLAYNRPYYDEGGTRHHHDTNERTTRYECSQGHRWGESYYASCKCGWSGGPTTITPLEPVQAVPYQEASAHISPGTADQVLTFDAAGPRWVSQK